MTPYEKILGTLSSCTMTQRALFTCACAERAHAVVAAIAEPITIEFSRAALEKAWNSVYSPVSLRSTHEELVELPEAGIDDSNDPKYYVMRALGLIADALCAANDEPDDVAASAAGGALDLASDLAHVSGEPTLPDLESAAQLDTLAALQMSETPPTMEELRRIGRDAGEALARAADVVSRGA
ncbi:MAG: hypothetical protein E6J90_37795 [Deltaproteobacteria bacterium]|nr:MAG: hypothetical protein E6J90_37795 [Deltaproteobacteria bacterium]TMQ19350.1 MAG: hypothetical protein E6J91_06390 [Deltaproteobacteria bacterium]